MIRTQVLSAIGASLLLAGCISLTPEAPAQLLTLTSSAQVPAGHASEGDPAAALAVRTPSVTQRLNVTRIPVITSDSSLAYLADAYWVEKPAQLFANVLAETIRSQSSRMVVTGGAMEYTAATQLAGELAAMDYDAVTGSVLVRYDAVLQLPGGRVLTRRFEERIDGVAPEATAVGAALNEAANTVANQVAEWVG